MNVEVRFLGLESSEALRDHALKQVRTHLGRFGREITSVVVRIADINGPKGGLDKRCQITVRGPRVGLATVDDLCSDAYAAADSAVERVGQTLRRSLAQRRSDKRRGVTSRGEL